MIENTVGELFPEVKDVVFKVSDVPKKDFYESGQAYYKFVFEAMIEGVLTNHKENVAIWMCAPFFKAFGCEEIKPGSFDVSPSMILGTKIIASIKHETAKKGKSAGKMFSRMYDQRPFGTEKKEEEIPF